MNRLILIGNGFDLAHGLKTSYKDFIIWYLADCLSNVGFDPKIYEDELLKIRFNDTNSFISMVNAHKPGRFNTNLEEGDLANFITNLFKEQTIDKIFNNEFINGITSIDKDGFNKKYNTNDPFDINIKSAFLRSLIINCQDCNWVDIENEYFDQLKKCRNKDDVFNEDKVKQLNSEFTYLKQKLETYLTLQQEQANIEVIQELFKAIDEKYEISDFEPIMGYEAARLSLNYDKTIPEIRHNLYFLNFNYTDTVQKYLDKLNTTPTVFWKKEVNYIHGQLNNLDNPIIFGFGDEHDKQYTTFEEYRNNQLFKHIKSYQYLKTPNYRNLINYLNSGEYQVFVMGHSCGLSDRTMFKEIFEHENCKSIRLFHYNNDFLDRAINVSKHFSNKGHMRKLIVNYSASDAFPQGK
ncbi:AbiH family protein [Pedobacter sp.]|uniref:AbiH family protein n=1 Tax=Pedobacter sp. TaxID=1411316 RepID=UPI0031D57002